MKSELGKFLKILDITREMYEADPKYFVDCFFNMYYQMKKKVTVDVICKGDEDLIKRTWSTLNFIKSMTSKRQPVAEALVIACKHYNTEEKDIQKIIFKFQAFKSTKKTKFKDLV